MKCYDITVDVNSFTFCVIASTAEEAREKAQAKLDEFSIAPAPAFTKHQTQGSEKNGKNQDT